MGLGGGDVGEHGRDNDSKSGRSGGGSGGGGGMFPGGAGPNGPAGYGGYGTFNKDYGAGQVYGGYGATENRSDTVFGRAVQNIFGYNAARPNLNPKVYSARDAVSMYMDHLTGKRGIVGRMAPTTAGVATDFSLSALGALSGPLAPGPVVGGIAAGVNVVSNYYEDKATAVTKLSEAGYSSKDVLSSFKDYESQLVAGLEGFGGGEGNKEYSDYDRQLAEGLKAQAGGEDMKTSTSDKSNVEEMRTARRSKTQRVFAGGLGSTGANQVKKAKLLGQ